MQQTQPFVDQFWFVGCLNWQMPPRHQNNCIRIHPHFHPRHKMLGHGCLHSLRPHSNPTQNFVLPRYHNGLARHTGLRFILEFEF